MLIEKELLLNAIDLERRFLVKRQLLGAEHVIVHHARWLVEDAPPVDAIPVEWLKTQADNAPNSVIQAAADYLLELWHGEQRNGAWEPLGHRMGFLKHPLSEDYRCSLCGYEVYTVLDPPPEICPCCGAKMDGKQTTPPP